MLISTLLENFPILFFTLFVLTCIKVYLVLTNLKNYKAFRDNPITVRGGLILDPILKRDLSKQNLLIKRYILVFIIFSVSLFIASQESEIRNYLYRTFVGAILLLELNHIIIAIQRFCTRSLFISKRNLVIGKIEYSAEFALKLASIQEFVFGISYLVFFLLFSESFFLGGAILSLIMAYRNWASKLSDPLPTKKESQKVSI